MSDPLFRMCSLKTPQHGFEAGTEGCVVYVHKGGVAYEIDMKEGVYTVLAEDVIVDTSE